MMKKVCFNGCSFTVGEGFDPEIRDQYIYDRLVSREFNFQRSNIAKGGSSNYEIFMRSAESLKQDFDLIFVQWSALNRMELYPGPDSEWSCNEDTDEFKYRSIYLDKSSNKRFREILRMMNHDYHQIIRVIDYCDILCRLAEKNNTRIIFINGLLPWTDDLDKPLGNDLFTSLSSYTKQILDFDNRDDIETKSFVQRLQIKFGTLDRSLWVNIFDSFRSNSIDRGPQGHHPGVKSHQIMAEKIKNYLIQYDLI